jgi:hypothetical protein
MISSARGLPTYPRNYRREVAPVLAIEPEPRDPYPDWMTGQRAEVEHDPDDWDFVGGDVEQVLLAQMVQPQRARYFYICWKPGHFSAECPLIPDSERAAIALRRDAVLKLRPRVLSDRHSHTRSPTHRALSQNQRSHQRQARSTSPKLRPFLLLSRKT